MLEKIKKFLNFKSANVPNAPYYNVISIPNGSFYESLFDGDNISPEKAVKYYSTTGAVATAVDMIGDEISNIDPVLSDDGNLTTDGEILEKLKKPNDFDSWSVFFENLSKDYLITGNNFIYVEGATSPTQVVSVEPQLVSGSVDSIDGRVDSYMVSTGSIAQGMYTRDPNNNNGVRYLNGTLKELSHGKAFSPNPASVLGQSLLSAVAKDVKQQILGKTHNIALIERGGRLSLAVIFKDTADTDQLNLRREHIKEQFQGADKAGAIATFGASDMDIQELGKSIKDMDFANLDMVARQATYMRYKIPLPLVSEKATQFKNFTAAIETLYDRAVLPVVNRLFEQLSFLLLPRYGLDPLKVKLTYDPEQITALKSRRLEEIAERRKINIETVNELREDLPGKEPIEGGDTLYQPATMVPIGTDLMNTTDGEL